MSSDLCCLRSLLFNHVMRCVCNRIGNRLESTEGTASATTYGANDVNAYDWVQPPSPDPQEYFCYDEDGNLLRDGKTTSNCPGTDGLREYKWDAENRLIEVIPLNPSLGAKRVKFRDCSIITEFPC